MTTTELSKAQLATILSALDERPRKPANRTEALKALARSAERYGLTAAEVLAAAPGLLDGRIGPEQFRAELQDSTASEDPDHDARQEGGDTAATTAEADGGDDTPHEAPEADTGAAPADDEAADAAGEPAAADGETVAAAAEPTGKPSVRAGTKQALMIELLRRPEGATIEEVVDATGWQRHTVRGAISGALKTKLGLDVTSDKVEGRGRVYRILT